MKYETAAVCILEALVMLYNVKPLNPSEFKAISGNKAQIEQCYLSNRPEISDLTAEIAQFESEVDDTRPLPVQINIDYVSDAQTTWELTELIPEGMNVYIGINHTLGFTEMWNYLSESFLPEMHRRGYRNIFLEVDQDHAEAVYAFMDGLISEDELKARVPYIREMNGSIIDAQTLLELNASGFDIYFSDERIIGRSGDLTGGNPMPDYTYKAFGQYSNFAAMQAQCKLRGPYIFITGAWHLNRAISFGYRHLAQLLEHYGTPIFTINLDQQYPDDILANAWIRNLRDINSNTNESP